jgi:hypothetical protein
MIYRQRQDAERRSVVSLSAGSPAGAHPDGKHVEVDPQFNVNTFPHVTHIPPTVATWRNVRVAR